MIRNATLFAFALILAAGLSISPAAAEHHQKAAPPHGEHDHGDHTGHEKKTDGDKKPGADGHEGHHEHEGHEGGHPKTEDKK